MHILERLQHKCVAFSISFLWDSDIPEYGLKWWDKFCMHILESLSHKCTAFSILFLLYSIIDVFWTKRCESILKSIIPTVFILINAPPPINIPPPLIYQINIKVFINKGVNVPLFTISISSKLIFVWKFIWRQSVHWRYSDIPAYFLPGNN